MIDMIVDEFAFGADDSILHRLELLRGIDAASPSSIMSTTLLRCPAGRLNRFSSQSGDSVRPKARQFAAEHAINPHR